MTENETDTLPEFEAVELRRLYDGSARFAWGSTHVGDLPEADRVEIAFAGRSNVGKSSLINALTGQNGLAISSKTPGRTRQLNFFTLAGDKAYLVDMPGYGYAKISHSERDAWDELIVRYLKGRQNLRVAFLLVDSRHGLKETDHRVLKLLSDAAVATRVIMTKMDETRPSELQRNIMQTEAAIRKYGAVFPHVMVVSSHKADGIDDLRALVASYIVDI